MENNIKPYKNEEKINKVMEDARAISGKEVISWIEHKGERIFYFNASGLKGDLIIELLKYAQKINSLLETGEKKRSLYNLHMMTFSTNLIPHLKAYQDSSEHVFHKSALINLRGLHRFFLKVFEGSHLHKIDKSIFYPKTRKEALDWLAEDDNYYDPTKVKKFD